MKTTKELLIEYFEKLREADPVKASIKNIPYFGRQYSLEEIIKEVIDETPLGKRIVSDIDLIATKEVEKIKNKARFLKDVSFASLTGICYINLWLLYCLITDYTQPVYIISYSMKLILAYYSI